MSGLGHHWTGIDMLSFRRDALNAPSCVSELRFSKFTCVLERFSGVVIYGLLVSLVLRTFFSSYRPCSLILTIYFSSNFQVKFDQRKTLPGYFPNIVASVAKGKGGVACRRNVHLSDCFDRLLSAHSGIS